MTKLFWSSGPIYAVKKKILNKIDTLYNVGHFGYD